MSIKSKLNRRAFMQVGLGAGAGLALWELYRTNWGSAAADRGAASLLAFKEMGLDDARLVRLLQTALDKSGQYADVFLEYSVGTYMIFDGDRMQTAGVNVTSGAGIRVISEGSSSFCSTDDLSWESLVRTAQEASANARAGGQQQQRVAPLKPLVIPNLYQVNAPAAVEPAREKQAQVMRMIEAAQKADPRIGMVRTLYHDTLRFITVATSDGVIARDTQPLMKVNLSVIATDTEKVKTAMGVFSGGGHYGLEYFKEHSPEHIGQRAAEMARHQLEGVAPPSGEMPVVLGPAYSGVLFHEAVGHGLEADFNLKGYSAYANRVGQMVASPLCTVYDDGRRENLNGSINFDDEGIASRNTLLIEKGRLAGYLHSRETAAKMGAQPTGNGRRQSFNFPPLPRMTNTYLQGGDATSEDIIRSVDKGIYARFFSGGSVNTTTGDFTFVPMEAFLIEKGRITAPLSNVLLLGNGPEVLKRVSMVGNDMQISDNLWECGKMGQMIPVTVGTPTIKVDKMNVGGIGSRS
jgi:TldD protein